MLKKPGFKKHLKAQEAKDNMLKNYQALEEEDKKCNKRLVDIIIIIIIKLNGEQGMCQNTEMMTQM